MFYTPLRPDQILPYDEYVDSPYKTYTTPYVDEQRSIVRERLARFPPPIDSDGPKEWSGPPKKDYSVYKEKSLTAREVVKAYKTVRAARETTKNRTQKGAYGSHPPPSGLNAKAHGILLPYAETVERAYFEEHHGRARHMENHHEVVQANTRGHRTAVTMTAEEFIGAGQRIEEHLAGSMGHHPSHATRERRMMNDRRPLLREGAEWVSRSPAKPHHYVDPHTQAREEARLRDKAKGPRPRTPSPECGGLFSGNDDEF